MRGPLAVTIIDGATQRHVTAATSQLRFTKTAPGGFAFADMRLRLPRGTFPDLGPADRVIVSDARTGRIVWEGFAENPGSSDGPGGQEFALSAIGTVTLASDNSQPCVYVDRDLSNWDEVRYNVSAISATAQSSDDPTLADTDGSTNPGLLCQINPGQPVGPGKVAAIRYLAVEAAGQQLGVVRGAVKSGKVDTGYVADFTTRVPSGAGSTEDILVGGSSQISTTAAGFDYRAGTTVIPDGRTRVELRLRRKGAATNVADDDTWSFFYDVAVLARLRDRFGDWANMVSAQAAGALTTYEVVADLLGRAMPWVDARAADLLFDSLNRVVDQLAYTDGASPQQILDDLNLWAPDLLWEVLEHTGNGWRFNYRAWPTSPRYIISSVRDGIDLPGGEVDLCNRIAVYWTDEKGVRRTTVVTAAVPALDDLGRVRDADPIELEAGRGSEANALLIGQQILAAKNTPTKAGSASVARWILDRDTGRMVGPWEIEPGHLVRIRETGDDLRLTEVEYDDGDCVANLTLGQPVLTEDQRIARLSTNKRAV